jgi:uncharacterized protein (TIGR02246 family)
MTTTTAINLTAIASDEEAIQTILNDFISAWNAHDVKSFSHLFAEDADFTNVKGVSRHGRNAFEEFHAPLFKTIWANSTQTITEKKIRFIKPDVAAVDARWDLTGLKKPDGSDAPPRNGLLMFIMTKQASRWEITVMHNMDLPGSGSQHC